MTNEQRKSPRQPTAHTQVSVVDVESGVEFDAAAYDVSSAGLKFLSQLEPPVGADMHVRLSGDTSLKAMLRVLRVTKVSPATFEVAGSLSRVG
jgi:hypothetical protein